MIGRRGRALDDPDNVFPENIAAALHERAGFRVVGRRERIAELGGVWRDTLFLELRLP